MSRQGSKDKEFMKLAVRLAQKARGLSSPNPMVGALVVKDGRVIASGYHAKAGLAHAEVSALDEAGEKSRKATLYVTLEPCTHFGKTPPCVDRIIASGVREVVVGMIDPNPLNNGRGIEVLRSHGVNVRVGVMEDELRRLNESFIKYITKKLPFVTVKVAQSIDGKIAIKNGSSKWITSDRSRGIAHKIRRDYDAIMVGVNTVLRDDPKLDSWFSGVHPKKIVVDSRLSTPEDAKIFSSAAPSIIATLRPAPGQETENLNILGRKAKILEVSEKFGQVNLRDLMKKLARMEITSVLVEGGGTLIGSLFDENLVDKVMFFISPKVIGGKDSINSVMGKGVARIDKAFKLKDIRLRRIGEDFLIEGYI